MEKVKFKKELKGERIVLKEHPITFKHAAEAFEIIQRNRDIFEKYFLWVSKTKSPEDYFKGFLSSLEGKMDSGEKAEYIILLNDKFIGQIGFFSVDLINESGEIGYWLDKEFVGNGYMQEAVKVLEKHIFDLAFNKIVIVHDSHNPKSKNVIERMGYIYEGASREGSFLDNKKNDRLNYSKLKSEYKV